MLCLSSTLFRGEVDLELPRSASSYVSRADVGLAGPQLRLPWLLPRCDGDEFTATAGGGNALPRLQLLQVMENEPQMVSCAVCGGGPFLVSCRAGDGRTSELVQPMVVISGREGEKWSWSWQLHGHVYFFCVCISSSTGPLGTSELYVLAWSMYVDCAGNACFWLGY